MNHVEVMSSSLSPGGQSVSVCVQRWMKEGENSIKAQRCIFHSTNKDKQKPEHVGLCFVSADGSLCVQTAVKDLKNNFWIHLLDLRTDWVLQWGLCDEEKVMQQRPLVSRLRITGEPNWSRNWWGDRWGSGVVWSDLTSSLVIQITTCITGTNRYKETYSCLKATSLKILLSSSDFLYIQY